MTILALAATVLVYFGTYTGPKSKGIYVAPFDTATGKLGALRVAGETENPSFLALHPKRPLLYAVNEIDNYEGQKAGAVTAFAIDPETGDLRALSRASTRGAAPCHLVVDGSGGHVLVANYSGGSVASLPIRADGGVEAASSFVQHAGTVADPKRQKGPHGHMIETDKANRFALAADLGLDQILVYKFDAKSGALTPAQPPYASVAPRSGPRHFAFSPDGSDVYVLNEISVTVTAFKYKDGRLTEYQTVPAMPGGAEPTAADSGAEIAVHPSGRFVYTSQRGPDNIAVFARDGATGRLTLVEHVASGGKTPRGFGIDPTGRWMIVGNQRSDSILVFAIDPKTGRLTPTGQTAEVGAPVSVTFRTNPAR
ncbi:MAG TPA: lactonase family protein [Vicinamibacteria bacterium]|nr:lactonase family protein [Vicinamibacteria bacterium]